MTKALPLSFALLLLTTTCALAQKPAVVKATPDIASGVYDPGQNVTWTIKVTQDNAPAAGEVTYKVLRGGLEEIAQGKAELKDGQATVSATRNDPGVLTLSIQYKPAQGPEAKGLGAAAFAPDKVQASAPPPDDFDAFWKGKIEALAAIPLNAELKPVDVGKPNVEYYQFTLDNIGGTKVYGQLAKPKDKTNLPALLQVQWAGVYPLHRDWVLGHAANGWLAVNIIAHDLPIDQPEDFYKQKAAKELNDYPGIGNEDRETSYFLRMFLSCHRAVEFITQRPDWNKKTLVVHGGSQGGYQAIVTAGLHPAVTALAANVPAGCDHTGKQAHRLPGWPNWAGRTWQGKDAGKMLNAARYFDAMNFATRVKCPALVGLGLVDPVCPPEGVLATCNQLQGPKKLVIMPLADHGGDHKAYYQVYGPFLEEQKGK